MKTSCRTMMVGLIGLWLGGCSVVVFEDSAACPAQKTCPVDTIKVAPVPEGTELNALEQDDTAQNSKSADETASSSSRPNGITGQTALISPVDEVDQIDGHLSYFDAPEQFQLVLGHIHIFFWRGQPHPEMLQFFQPHLQKSCLLYTSPSPRDLSTSRMPSSA